MYPYDDDEDQLPPQGLAADLLRARVNRIPPEGLGASLMPAGAAGGASSTGAPATPAQAAVDPRQLFQLKTLFGETGGLIPQLKPGTKGVYHSANWDPESTGQLQMARQYMAGVSLNNPGVHQATPDFTNGVQRMIWGNVGQAVQQAKNVDVPPDVKNFFIRQDGKGPQAPGWAIDKRTQKPMKPYKTFGPFINVGGGDVPAGAKTYIDFYQGVP